MALKKETIEKEFHQISNPWKIRKTSSKACQTDNIKGVNKSCQTAPLIPKTLSQALILKHMQTQTFQTYNSNDESESNTDSLHTVDTIEQDEFIMLDS